MNEKLLKKEYLKKISEIQKTKPNQLPNFSKAHKSYLSKLAGNWVIEDIILS